VTKSLPPASVAPPAAKDEKPDPAAENLPPGSAKTDGSSGFALSKPPPSKKAGARDSVPPGAG
jgi:hypothetical protein